MIPSKRQEPTFKSRDLITYVVMEPLAYCCMVGEVTCRFQGVELRQMAEILVGTLYLEDMVLPLLEAYWVLVEELSHQDQAGRE